MIPWLLVSELLSQSGRTLSELVGEYIEKFPCSGEINYTVKDTEKAIEHLTNHYATNRPETGYNRWH